MGTGNGKYRWQPSADNAEEMGTNLILTKRQVRESQSNAYSGRANANESNMHA
jgi:hypothetical protein